MITGINRIAVFVLAGTLCVLAGCAGRSGKPSVTPDKTSQEFREFIVAVRAAPAGERTALIDLFMEEAAEDGFPVVEDTLAHFIYRGDDSSIVAIPGDFNGWNPQGDQMTLIEGTNFYYRTKSFEIDARLDYKFVINGSQWILDLLNPATVTGGFGPNSEIAMPGYVRPEEIDAHTGMPCGTIDTLFFHSDILNNDRHVYIYLPSRYSNDDSRRYPSLYVNDGGEYLTLASMHNVLDYLIDRDKIEEVIVVFVDPINRNVEYRLNDQYKNFIVSELVPHIDETYRTAEEPSKRGIMGASIGGLISFYIAYEHPNLFGLCAGQSSAFYIYARRMINTIAVGPKRELRFYLDWGTYETRIMQSNYEMRDALMMREYPLEQFEYHEGHSWGSWRAHTDDILKTFFKSE